MSYQLMEMSEKGRNAVWKCNTLLSSDDYHGAVNLVMKYPPA